MPPLSEHARLVLSRMEPDRRYEMRDLRAFVPHLNMEALREIMQELWIDRQVERVESSGWRRHLSASPAAGPAAPARGHVQLVKSEDLFDHATFSDFFK